MSTVIKVENLSKRYYISHQQKDNFPTLRDTVSNAAVTVAKRLLHPLRAASGQPIAGVGNTEEFWALNDISFDVKQGDRIGIIGRNGAGKSTLLKILSRITEPTSGRVCMKGRVASLLEVGTGFHPELTGRENIFLNGAILGMRKDEIIRKFDEIVDFSGVSKFLDTPVKRYSSGMYVRLAFSVAAHLEPEILVVDEVLAVGDAQFQKKCLGKMNEVANQGRTILFVSHNLPSIARLCNRVVWLHEGNLIEDGLSQKVVENYLNQGANLTSSIQIKSDSRSVMKLLSLSILDQEGTLSKRLEMGQSFDVCVEYEVNQPVSGAHVICFISTIEGVIVLGCGDADCNSERLNERDPGFYKGTFTIPAFLLGEGLYSITVSLSVPFGQIFDRHEDVLSFEVFDSSSCRRNWQHQRRPGLLGLEIPWTVSKVKDFSSR